MNKKQKRNSQTGITLIALVITIIILLILAIVSIKLVMNSGIIIRAEKGVDEYSKAQEDETAKLLQLEYEEAKLEGKTTGTFTDYILETRYSGIKIGDYINYKEYGEESATIEKDKSGRSDDQTISKEELNWRVLGVNEKGKLELISDNPSSEDIYLYGEKGYLYGSDELNRMCNELYGKGKYATGARSLNVEDINKLANYNPQIDYSTYGKESKYTTKAWLDYGDQIVEATAENPLTIKNTSYTYQLSNRIKDENIVNMISKGTGDSTVDQWLASRCVFCGSYYASLSMYYINSDVNYCRLLSGDLFGYRSGKNYHIRPVIILSFDIQIDKNGKDGTTADNAYTIK